MTTETEAQLVRAIDSLSQKIEKLDNKLDKFIESTNQALTSVQINQVKLQGKIDALRNGD